MARWEDPRIAPVPAELILSLPAGGWDNCSINDARLPADFVVDFVRARQRKDLAATSDEQERAAP